MNPESMATKSCISEIVEATDESCKVLSMVGTAGKRRVLKPGQICSVEDDINQLFETIDIRNSYRSPGALKHKNSLRKSAMKRPMHYSSSGVGISESVSLKQALRGLCISQASEMAAMRRLSKQTGSSEAGTIKDLFKSVVVKATASGYPNHEVDIDIGSGTSKIFSPGPHTSIKCDSNGKETYSPSSTGNVSDLNGIDVGPDRVKSDADSRNLISRTDDSSRSREKGDFSQSSKSSIGEYSISTSISEESTLCGSSRGGYRPHMSKDLRWESIHHIEKHHGRLNLRHFKILKKIGSGDIGNVYLAELIGRNCLFGLKVMDNAFLASRKKMGRAQIEREILQMLDHPFLPTLFSHFTTDKYLCLVMEYCPGGDLHVLRQKQPSKCFSEPAARFYVSEVLLALEYLHMLGVVYRDLKPENILIREDGHIMLSDFDLSFRCAVDPIPLLKSSNSPPKKHSSSPCTDSSCIQPFCLHHPSWQVPCFTPNFTSRPSKLKPDFSSKLPQFVAEPTGARSNSFVGTHEYLAPEVIKGEGHGSAVDWWALGIFLYELVYGKTPFKGSGNEDTLSNVTSQSLRFPSCPIVSSDTRDLIRGLLVKDPVNRLGASEGAAEIKQHPFFKGMNWALIRCALPPELPKISELGLSLQEKESTASLEEDASARDDVEFEMF